MVIIHKCTQWSSFVAMKPKLNHQSTGRRTTGTVKVVCVATTPCESSWSCRDSQNSQYSPIRCFGCLVSHDCILWVGEAVFVVRATTTISKVSLSRVFAKTNTSNNVSDSLVYRNLPCGGTVSVSLKQNWIL